MNDKEHVREWQSCSPTPFEGVPDDAMWVSSGNLGSHNYVRFKSTHILEWYTVWTAGEREGDVQCETFVQHGDGVYDGLDPYEEEMLEGER